MDGAGGGTRKDGEEGRHVHLNIMQRERALFDARCGRGDEAEEGDGAGDDGGGGGEGAEDVLEAGDGVVHVVVRMRRWTVIWDGLLILHV